VLREIVEQSIDAAIAAAREQEIDPDRLIVLISCPSFENDVVLHIQSINEDTVNSILHRLEAVDQSNKAKHRGSLYGNVFTVDITAISGRQLRQVAAIQRGAGRRHFGSQRQRRLFNPYVRRNRLDLIRIVNTDQLCLFRALLLGKMHRELTRIQFHRYCRNQQQIEWDVHQLMLTLNIPLDLDSYDIETWGQKVEHHFNRNCRFPIKIFAFNDASYYTPIFEGQTDYWERDLCVYFNNNHYDLIRNVRSFFCVRKYCFKCYKPYQTDSRHNMKCKARCINCTSVKRGNCPEDPNFPPVSCLACGKHFVNAECYSEHKLKGICRKIKRCIKCGVIYDLRNHKPGHKCQERFCRRCQGFHLPTRLCYIKPLKKEEGEVDYRIIIYDFETTQDTQPDPGILRFFHNVNFIAARVICTQVHCLYKISHIIITKKKYSAFAKTNLTNPY
jgi:hypothetical protein